jgi:hypothetical protein
MTLQKYYNSNKNIPIEQNLPRPCEVGEVGPRQVAIDNGIKLKHVVITYN